VKIYKIFAGRTGNFYLSRPTEELAKFNQYLSELEKKLGDVRFVAEIRFRRQTRANWRRN